MIVFTPNTVIKSADVNFNFDELKTKTDYLSTPDSAWIAPTFTNSWVNYNATFNQAGYRKDAFGWVILRGLVRSGTANASIFTLPVGYRPEYQELISIQSNDTEARLDIATTGTITPSGASNAWVSLDNIRFKAYQ